MPVSANATLVVSSLDDSTAPPATVLPFCDWNRTNACGSADAIADGTEMPGSVGAGVVPAWHATKASATTTVIAAPAARGATCALTGVMEGPPASKWLVISKPIRVRAWRTRPYTLRRSPAPNRSRCRGLIAISGGTTGSRRSEIGTLQESCGRTSGQVAHGLGV
jgi:hypothetical protein